MQGKQMNVQHLSGRSFFFAKADRTSNAEHRTVGCWKNRVNEENSSTTQLAQRILKEDVTLCDLCAFVV
jgi:hypothetical protein